MKSVNGEHNLKVQKRNTGYSFTICALSLLNSVVYKRETWYYWKRRQNHRRVIGLRQEALLLQRDRATRLSVVLLTATQIQKTFEESLQSMDDLQVYSSSPFLLLVLMACCYSYRHVTA